MNTITIQCHCAIHVGSRWKIQDRRQIKNRHATKTKHQNAKYNTTKL